MPELLLSSAPAKQLNKNLLTRADDASKKVSSDSVDAAATKVNKENRVNKENKVNKDNKEDKFNNLLSSIVKKSASEMSNKPSDNEFVEAVDDLVKELAKLDPNSEALSDIRSFLDGQDMSSLSLDNTNDGASLPEFLTNLESLINSMLESVDETTGLSLSESLDKESAGALQSAFMNFNAFVSDLAGKSGASIQSSSDLLLGFSFNGGTNQGKGQWQQYDPQQLSQPSGVLQGDQASNLLSEQLLPEADKNFQAHMEKLTAKSMTDGSEISDSLLDTPADVKDKPAFKFSELQLRTPNESLKQYSTTLSTPVNSQQWSDEVSQKIVWFTGRNIQAAEMHLNPADLGPIDVKVHVQNDVTSVTFNVNNASVRDLLESNVVRLREMMEANGVNVGEVNVDSGSREQSQQSGEDSGENDFGQSPRNGQDDSELVMREQEVNIKQSNLVDYFV